ncbi:hypothetical protein ACFXK0_08315 [Nocardia sp. NPDC059177]|uniref:hypothetical protein n=1 Tax=Nocardia sp. NPDC059177 TaxID=3346759 RepID=UPI003673C3AC
MTTIGKLTAAAASAALTVTGVLDSIADARRLANASSPTVEARTILVGAPFAAPAAG